VKIPSQSRPHRRPLEMITRLLDEPLGIPGLSRESSFVQRLAPGRIASALRNIFGTLLGGIGLVAGASSSAAYSIPLGTMDAGGGRMQSANYTLDSSFDELGNISRTADATITVRVGFPGQLNDSPVAANAQFSAGPGITTILLTATDIDRDPLSFQIISGPAHGTLSGNPPTLSYTPGPGFTTADQFTFGALDGFNESAPATILLVGNAPALHLLPPILVNGNEFQIDIEGRASACYRLEGSVDLVDWSIVAKDIANVAGLIHFSDRSQIGINAKFYRVVEISCSISP